MSFFERFKASAGTENANMGISVAKAKVRQGSLVSGSIYIKGGGTDQKINGVYLSVLTSVLVGEADRKAMQDAEIQKLQVSEAFRLAAHEEKTIPFSLELSPETPITIHKVDVWLKAVLDPPLDEEPTYDLHVIGTEAAENILIAIRELDFPIKKVINAESRRTASGVLQEFEFFTNQRFKRQFSEMEVVFLSDKEKTTAHIRLDREERTTENLLARQMDEQESKLILQYLHNEVPGVDEMTHQLQDLLKRKR